MLPTIVYLLISFQITHYQLFNHFASLLLLLLICQLLTIVYLLISFQITHYELFNHFASLLLLLLICQFLTIVYLLTNNFNSTKIIFSSYIHRKKWGFRILCVYVTSCVQRSDAHFLSPGSALIKLECCGYLSWLNYDRCYLVFLPTVGISTLRPTL